MNILHYAREFNLWSCTQQLKTMLSLMLYIIKNYNNDVAIQIEYIHIHVMRIFLQTPAIQYEVYCFGPVKMYNIGFRKSNTFLWLYKSRMSKLPYVGSNISFQMLWLEKIATSENFTQTIQTHTGLLCRKITPKQLFRQLALPRSVTLVVSFIYTANAGRAGAILCLTTLRLGNDENLKKNFKSKLH